MKTIMKADILLIEEGIRLLLDILEDLDENEQLEFRKELEELLERL